MRTTIANDVAKVLYGSWRAAPPFLKIPEDRLQTAIPALLATGTSALAWRKLIKLDLAQTPSLSALQQGYRKHMVEAAVHERQVKDIFDRMRKAGVEPVLFKGWAMARLYPDPGLRPYGDIDLWLPSDRLTAAYSALPSGRSLYCVELHTSFYKQYERTIEAIIQRSELIPFGDVNVRLPGHEDHLRFLCLHFLFHGAWRPLWLCDIALMVESRAPSFDWDRCLGGKRKYADWIACVVGLAHELLGADVAGTPVESRARDLPKWLAPAVLRQWAEGSGMSHTANLSFSFARRFTNPAALCRAMREHWRNPVQASVELNARFSNTPRAPLQIASAFLRLPDFVKYFGREIPRQ